MTLKHMASRTMRLAYDRDSDVLYIAFGLPNPGWMRRWDSFFLRRDEAKAAFSA